MQLTQRYRIPFDVLRKIKKIKTLNCKLLSLIKTFWRSKRALPGKTHYSLGGFGDQIFGFPWCSTREDHSIDVSITIVGLILTKLR